MNMKTLNIKISESDFIKYNLQNELLSFDEFVEKIQAQLTKYPTNKAKFEDTPAFNMWQDREDMADEEIKSPSWHEDILNERMQSINSGKAKFISIQELKNKNL